MATTFIGIDPGQSGGVAVLDTQGTVVLVIKMPPTDQEVLAELAPFAGFEDGSVRAVIERVHAMPRQGVSSTFKFGVSVGKLLMALMASKIPFDEVTPQRWQAALGCRCGPRERRDKNVTKRRAAQLFPSVKVTHAVADSLLIAEYCRRVHTGVRQ